MGGPTLAPTLGTGGPGPGAGLNYAGGGRFFAGGAGGGCHAGGNNTAGGGGGGRAAGQSWSGGAYGTQWASTGTQHGGTNTGGGGSGAGGKDGQYAAGGGAGGPGVAVIRYAIQPGPSSGPITATGGTKFTYNGRSFISLLQVEIYIYRVVVVIVKLLSSVVAVAVVHIEEAVAVLAE